jgi:GT2 family glycosyltransferase
MRGRTAEMGKEEIVNSQEYWEKRFADNDWEKYDGNGQSEFFAKTAMDNFPDFLVEDLSKNQWDAIDVGCGEGDGTAVWAKNFPSISFTGQDFSKSAIEKARSKYTNVNFEVNDIYQNIRNADVIFSSNTLEHLKQPKFILRKLCDACNKYAVIVLPFEDDLDLAEHINRFNFHFFNFYIGDCYLLHFKVIDCEPMNSPFWKGKQILLIYANNGHKPMNLLTADNINNIFADDLKRISAKLYEKEKLYKQQILELSEKNDEKCIAYENEIKEIKNETKVLTSEYEKQISNLHVNELEIEAGYEKQIANLQCGTLKVREGYEQQIRILQDKITQEREASEESIGLLQKSIDDERAKYTIEINEKEIEYANKVAELGNVRSQYDRYFASKSQIENAIWDITEQARKIKLFKIAYLFYRFNNQAIHGNRQQCKDFWHWVKNNIGGKPLARDYQYNQFRRIQKVILDNKFEAPNQNEITGVTDDQLKILKETYDQADILMFGVIDYDFRHQRPQHFAERFAKNGHRVFYFNANFTRRSGVEKVMDNLYIITLNLENFKSIYVSDFANDMETFAEEIEKYLNYYCIRDAITVIDYPNWINVAIYLRRKFGFKFVTDYMDDFTGFLSTTGKQLCTNCKMLLATSDLIIASSKYLIDIASKYNENCNIIRNGTEYDHFNKARKAKEHNKKVIGYYGAVAHWFDYKKICYIADRFNECEIMIVGDVTSWREELTSKTNIVLVGEKQYAELPEYLSYFDVCLIPFDTSTNLIKATNPVKFYEYLSAGKKIVATEIPELEPYKDIYVYMSNENSKFGDYIELCLNNTDDLATPDKMMDFAKTNDWEHRYQDFCKCILNAVPRVSIIVVTYNNLAYNKLCINRILRNTAYPNYELLIVDNNSIDGTVEWLRSLQNDKLKIIFNSENKGFAGGNNDGLRIADGDYVVLLNNDTIPTRGWLSSLVKHAENNENIAMVGAVTNSIGNEAFIAANYNSLFSLDVFAYEHTRSKMNEQFRNPQMLAMFCTLIRKKVIEKCGLLDERYGLGFFEDDDYCYNVIKNGYEITIAEDSYVHHFQSMSFSKLASEKYKKLIATNQKLYEEKWGVKWNCPHYRDGIKPDTNNGVYVNVEEAIASMEES